jgi:type IV pilus assembly protein PilB
MDEKERLGDRLIRQGFITADQLQHALADQLESGDLLGQVLIRLGYINSEDLGSIIQTIEAERNSELFSIEQYSSHAEDVDLDLLSVISEELIRKYKFFPVKKKGGKLYIAIADVFNVTVLDDLRLLTGFDIYPLQTTEQEVSNFIERNFSMPEVEKAILEITQDMGRDEDEDVVSNEQVDDAPVIRLVNTIILKAISEDASDIHIEPGVGGVQVRFRVDGVLHKSMSLPRRMTHPVLSRIKVMSNMDIAERRSPQDGRIPLKISDRNLDLRVSTLPTIYGEKAVIRILDKESLRKLSLDKLGFSSHNLEKFENFLKASFGMILLSGPTGSGKTTTLYVALKALNTVDVNIVTVEDPVEYVLDGINQAQVHSKIGANFATYLRSILRQDPDVIMIGEIRDQETAEIAVRSATTGHLVLSTLHTNDAPGVINRLIDMGVEPFMVASSLIGAVSQRLVRKICPNCRDSYVPSEAELVFAGFHDQEVELFAGKGCGKCNHTGYRGRLTIHELMVVTPSIQKLILNSPSNDELRQVALREGMISLKDDGIDKVRQGLTTIREIMRVAFREESAE